jgi:hypothetical protein
MTKRFGVRFHAFIDEVGCEQLEVAEACEQLEVAEA